MNRAIVIGLGLIVWLGSCTQRLVCPAYQSAFIYDKEELRKKFSYFQDTVPKVYTASKNKYLVAEAVPYRKKVRSLQTVAARPVMVVVPDSLSGKSKEDSVISHELDMAARSVIDSTMIVESPSGDSVKTLEEDSIYVITKGREVQLLKYNTPDTVQFDSVNRVYIYPRPVYYIKDVRFGEEQDTYMWYLRHSLVLPDVRIAKMQSGEKRDKKGSVRKKGIGGFFKNLFRKRTQEKEDIDSAELEIAPDQEDRFDFIDTTAQEAPESIEQAPKKKGFLSRGRNKDEALTDPLNAADNRKRKKKKAADASKPKVKKEGDEGDGF